MPDPIRFDATLDQPAHRATDNAVLRSGKVFHVGVFPDKDFALTEADADAAVAAFAPVPADYEHVAGPLDGQLGTLQRVWRQGTDLLGEVAVPAWLDPLLRPTGHKVSLAWDRATKQIVGWGWVRNPRINDAVLYAAFTGARHSSSDQRALDSAHEAIVAAGATCAPPTQKEARMSLWDHVKAALEGTSAATFSDEGGGGTGTTSTSTNSGTGGGTSTTTTTTSSPPATPPSSPPSTSSTSDSTTTSGNSSGSAQMSGSASAYADPGSAALMARIAELETTHRDSQATTFADDLVLKGRIPPALRGAALALYSCALADDSAHAGTVTFSDGTGTPQTGSRAALVTALFAALPATPITREVLTSLTPLPGQRPPTDPLAAVYDEAAKYAEKANRAGKTGKS